MWSEMGKQNEQAKEVYYDDITKVFLEKYPDNDKEKFPREAEAAGNLSKERIPNKLKKNKVKLRCK